MPSQIWEYSTYIKHVGNWQENVDCLRSSLRLIGYTNLIILLVEKKKKKKPLNILVEYIFVLNIKIIIIIIIYTQI